VTPFKALYYLYFGVFEAILVFLKNFGIVGEILFTVYGICWLGWPLYAAYKLENSAFYIPGSVVTIFFVVLGRRAIQRN